MQIMRALFKKKYKEKALCDDIVMPSFNYVTTGKLDYQRRKLLDYLRLAEL